MSQNRSGEREAIKCNYMTKFLGFKTIVLTHYGTVNTVMFFHSLPQLSRSYNPVWMQSLHQYSDWFFRGSSCDADKQDIQVFLHVFCLPPIFCPCKVSQWNNIYNNVKEYWIISLPNTLWLFMTKGEWMFWSMEKSRENLESEIWHK